MVRGNGSIVEDVSKEMMKRNYFLLEDMFILLNVIIVWFLIEIEKYKRDFSKIVRVEVRL